MDTDKTLCWERRIQVLENENKALHKELAIKNVISEISRFQGKDDKISLIYKKIFSLISEIIHIDNFYICVINDGLIDIPFAVDQFDKLTSDIRNEKSNPELRNSLTAYAIKKGKSLALNEEEIIKLEKKGKFKLLGKMPKQWIFLPFHTGNLDGGIVAQSYKKMKTIPTVICQCWLMLLCMLETFSLHITRKKKLNSSMKSSRLRKDN